MSCHVRSDIALLILIFVRLTLGAPRIVGVHTLTYFRSKHMRTNMLPGAGDRQEQVYGREVTKYPEPVARTYLSKYACVSNYTTHYFGAESEHCMHSTDDRDRPTARQHPRHAWYQQAPSQTLHLHLDSMDASSTCQKILSLG